jgi:hypothetical protein
VGTLQTSAMPNAPVTAHSFSQSRLQRAQSCAQYLATTARSSSSPACRRKMSPGDVVLGVADEVLGDRVERVAVELVVPLLGSSCRTGGGRAC